MRRGVTVVVVLALCLSAAAAGWMVLRPDSQQLTDPYTWRPAEWVAALGGEDGVSPEAYDTLNNANIGLPPQDVEALRSLGVRVTQYELSGTGQVDPGYVPPGRSLQREPQCRGKVTVKSVSAAAIPGSQGWAKLLVMYTGQCTPKYTASSPGVLTVYARKGANGWVEAQPWQVPHTDTSVPVELVQPECARDGVTLAVGVAVAWRQLCEQARKDGVEVTAVKGWVSATEHASTFQDASEQFGEELARTSVGFSDGVRCDARVCSGTAVTVEADQEGLRWLTEPVACTAGRVEDGCAGGTAVSRAESYGFIRPAGSGAGYLEYALPAAGSGEGSCTPYGQAVPAQVASVFKCRLAQAGYDPQTAATVAAEALLVSRCASGWNPDAALFEGRYASKPNPETGLSYPYSGLFGVDDQVLRSPWASTDPDAVIAASETAARVYIADGSWNRFYCATGGLPGVQAGPALPQYGGPDLPAWARRW